MEFNKLREKSRKILHKMILQFDVVIERRIKILSR